MRKKQTKTPEAAFRDLADEYGALEAELQPWKVKLKRQEELARWLRAYAQRAPAAEAVVIAGERYEITLSPRENKTVFAPLATLYKRLGKDVFLKVASVTLAALKAHVHPELVAELTRTEPVGPRAIVVRAKAKLAQAA